MKKLFSLITALVLCTSFVSAKTIYCKMEQGWWKVDNAAVGCHYWGTPGPGTSWPGVRMTPVEGEADLWSIDLDLEKVQNVIFTRVSPLGTSFADWGAKTKDLTIPTNDKNLFTITTSKAVWGDPGCDGEWSVYGTSPIVTEPTVTDIAIAGDKYVGTELAFTATVEGFSADPMIIYEVKAKDGEYAQAQGGKFTPTAAGDYTVKANAFYQPEEGDAEEASKEVNFTVTEAPVKEYYLVGWINGANSGCEDDYESFHEEYKFVDGKLTTTFTETSYVFVKTSGNSHWYLANAYVAPAAKVEATLAEGKAEKVGVNGNVEVTFTLTENADGTVTLSYEEAAAPVKYYAKNNWNGAAADDWSWLEMSATNKENFYMLDSVVFGGTGVNINDKEDDTDALWFAADAITVLNDLVGFVPPTPKPKIRDTALWAPAHSGVVLEAPQLLAGDTIKLYFNTVDSTLKAFITGRPAPAARKEFVFVAGEAADSDPAMFAITWGKDGSSETIKMTQKGEEALYTAEILETVDSVVLVRCATGATEIIWGEGTNVWNQTANYELCDTMYFGEWTEEGLFTLTCETPTPVETKYYAKNNWDGGEWSWKEMSATNKENIYMLDSVVFGGTGININTKEEDTDAFWFDVDHIVVLDDGHRTDTVIPSRPPYPSHVAAEEPEPLKLQAGDTIVLVFNIADTTLQAGIYGRLAPVARKEFVFVAGEAADSDPAMFAITWGKDGSSETVKMEKQEETLYAADILATVDSVVLVRCATGATEIIWGEGTNVWNQTANYALCDTMYFGEWTEEGLFTLTCEAPKPVEVKYYVTGNAALVGEEKAWQADAIEMVDYTHTFPMLAAGEYQLKVTDGTWERSWGYDNLSPTVAVEGLYTDVDGNICFTVYTPNDVTVTFAQGYVIMTGDFTNPQPADEGFGIILGDGTTIKGQKNEGQIEFLEYVTEANLTAGATFQLYDFANEAAWTVDNIDEASTPNLTINEDYVYEVTADGKYTIYLKMYGMGNDQVYCAYEGTGTGLDQLKAMPNQRFNILGLPVDANYRGVVIMNGKTYLQ